MADQVKGDLESPHLTEKMVQNMQQTARYTLKSTGFAFHVEE